LEARKFAIYFSLANQYTDEQHSVCHSSGQSNPRLCLHWQMVKIFRLLLPAIAFQQFELPSSLEGYGY
jgi:hypothetical protein